jgi:hypothetical protein
MRGDAFLLLLGEKAGMREVVQQFGRFFISALTGR